MKEDALQVPKGPFKFLFHSTRPYKFVAFLAVFFVVTATVASTAVPYIFKRIVDVITNTVGFGPENIWFWASAYILATLLEALSWRGSGFAGLRWATGVRATGREKLTEHITQHSYSFFSNRFAGALSTKLRTASEGIKSMVEFILWEWLGFSLKLIISLGFIFHTNIFVGSIFVLWLVLITPVNFIFARKRMALSTAAQESDTRLTAQTVDVLTNITAVQDYARRDFELERFNRLIAMRRNAGMRNWGYGEWIVTINNIFEAIFIAGIVFTTVSLWNASIITPGDIILILTIVVSIRGDLANLSRKFNSVSETLGQVKEGLTDTLHPLELVDSSKASELKIVEGEIRFENVSFKYGSKGIFTKLNLEIKPGQRIGLVGRSGAGKSTLMKLLLRQYDTTSGSILIDGQEIKGVKQESLRDSIAVVPQEPSLFHRSLQENIRYGKIDATDQEIRNAAKHAQAHNFINLLPDKYETLVGERGVKLSGGERQRVAIARAFLKNAKVLLLDEATSSLDSESENMIRKALEELMQGKTVIAIAHRLSTLRAMDRIIVIDDGRVVEDDSHENLIKLGGIYSELWAHQAGGFIKED